MAKVRLRPKRVFNRDVARKPGVRASVLANAEEVAMNARMIAAPHGSLSSRISVEQGDVDAYVVMTDDDTGKNEPAAAAIEFGGTFKDGHTQEGLHILGRATGMAAGG